ncbi:sugar ABC transporter ATPase [Pseudomonas cavernae]|uniref:Sugar ABC transporter ATPase n=1 Tax=Pseudomonas cavernae TaxID=2320867 RepID=A0A385Z189_9PSED|nr:sugar ABC transporter ATPase [Pseudomonas cavernae]AYC31967.1 sugar ABC transporter ATPase [Pseudomonas cavernae]
MSQQQSIIVPQISTFPGHEAKARAILRWLVQQAIVQPQLSHCGRGGDGLGYGIAVGASKVMHVPAGAAVADYLPFGQACNGLEVVTKRCIFTPMQGFDGLARCPECRTEIGEVLLDHLENWMPADTDNFICPECGHEDDINGFPFSQPCGFSNLGFIFNNWPAASFKQSFLDEFAQRLGRPIVLVQVTL